MPFTLDTDVSEKMSSKLDEHGKAQPLSERTIKDYTAKLNKLAKEGWDTRAKLKRNHDKVIAFIKTMYPEDNERGRHNKRFVIYAIFWAMDINYLKKPNPYYQYLQTIPPIVNVNTGEKWKSLDEFRAEQKDSE
jgi:hypothetical protein